MQDRQGEGRQRQQLERPPRHAAGSAGAIEAGTIPTRIAAAGLAAARIATTALAAAGTAVNRTAVGRTAAGRAAGTNSEDHAQEPARQQDGPGPADQVQHAPGGPTTP
jgi:hypothetical protein